MLHVLIMKMQIKITLVHHLVLDRMATARILMASTDRLQRKRNAYTLLVAVQSNTLLQKSVWTSFIKFKRELSYDQDILLMA